ncbi:MAG: proline--tRNA ligase [Thaumarchaeota archaeon]|nr:proline--tRNA ligase [Nitrososphaerota archaeon]
MSKEIGITVKKNEDFSEWYTQVVIKAQLADYAPVKGLIVLRPYGYSIWEYLRSSVDQKLKATGHENGFLPVLIPESLLSKEATHFAGFTPEVFWVTHSGNTEIGDRLALRPTSETLAYSMYSKWIKSWRDLPIKINFWNSALRAEIKATKPFLRTSEFLWQEGHTVHSTREEAEEEVMTILDIYKRTVEDELAIPVILGKKTDKEKFVGAVYTTTMESIMPDGKALQMGTSHFLGQNFSKPFDVKFLDKQNIETFAWQTSWGISWRLIGALIMVHGDDKGLVLPPRVAPIQVVIVPIYSSQSDRDEILKKANELKETLVKKDLRIHMDSREEFTPGYKFHDWEMKGVPLRIEIGPKDLLKNKMVIVRRDDLKKSDLSFESAEDGIAKTLDEIQKGLFEKAKKMLDNGIKNVNDFAQFKKEIEDGMFLYSSWCGDQKCEETVKESTGADIRVIPFDEKRTNAPCIVCGKPSKVDVMFAKGY